jgi:hypothetical protein
MTDLELQIKIMSYLKINGDVMNKSNQLQTEKNYNDWVKITNGKWERIRKGNKQRFKVNQFFNEKENIILYEKIIEDRSPSHYIDWIEYRVSKNGVSLNKVSDINDRKTVLRFDLQTNGWVRE